MTYCDNEYCENEAVQAVAVSVDSYGDQTRNFCTPCENAFTIGLQHATYRASFRLAEAMAEVIEMSIIEDSQPTLKLFSESDDVAEKRREAQLGIERGDDDEDGD